MAARKPGPFTAALLLLCAILFAHTEAHSRRSDVPFPPTEKAPPAGRKLDFQPAIVETHGAGPWAGTTIAYGRDEHGRVSSITVVVRDLQQVLPSALQVWFWLTPIVFSLVLSTTTSADLPPSRSPNPDSCLRTDIKAIVRISSHCLSQPYSNLRRGQDSRAAR